MNKITCKHRPHIKKEDDSWVVYDGSPFEERYGTPVDLSSWDEAMTYANNWIDSLATWPIHIKECING